MSALIDNVLDFARGRLGGGVALKRFPQPLRPILDQVIAELRSSSPGTKIETDFDLTRPIDCDGGRIAQLFSNLLGNSITHGSAASPIRVRATTQNREFELSVANSGKPIPREAMERLFQPFYPGVGAGFPARPRIGALHRLRDRPRPWRNHRRGIVARRDPIHVSDADRLSTQAAKKKRASSSGGKLEAQRLGTSVFKFSTTHLP